MQRLVAHGGRLEMGNEWRVEHASETYPDGDGGSTYEEWWVVSDGEREFRAEYQDDAQLLAAALSGLKDAARYRWARDTAQVFFDMPHWAARTAADVDAEIDAAMAAAPAVGAA